MILRLFGIGMLMFILFFAFLFSLPFLCVWPFGWHAPAGWLLFLLLIGLGVLLLARDKRTGQLAFGVSLLFVGAAFLANNFWDINLLRFWPALLILWGLALILQRRPGE
ncbi:MAG: DUF5668 domain-containing protein [candidate division Zixibacteria bacterium]|nr:DUF5668 domain-containing protein [candidate division Zixibacteria bacterium]MCI0595043.1 DUF5668 domain-containing protein [candidate division Zixibacteria bacterium]